MMYSNKFVVAVKCGGKVLREYGDAVRIPFGSEYSLLLKNLHTTKALATVDIDGRVAIADLIVEPNDSIELERFLGEDMGSGHRFRFIEKTEEVRSHRGEGAEDGLIRVEYRFEVPVVLTRTLDWRWRTWEWQPWEPPRPISHPTYPGYIPKYTTNRPPYGGATVFCSSSPDYEPPAEDAGITVPGSVSKQKFCHGHIGTLEPNSHSIVLRLVGARGTAPITVATKLRCSTCGRQWKSSYEFCGGCGTNLHA
jgi:hypothetical protein